MLPVVFGTFVGAMSTGFGHQPLLKQMGFVFILITVLGLGGMQLMPILIEERRFMKHETSEALYSEGASVLASFCVDVPLSSVGAALEILIMFSFAGFDPVHLNCIFFGACWRSLFTTRSSASWPPSRLMVSRRRRWQRRSSRSSCFATASSSAKPARRPSCSGFLPSPPTATLCRPSHSTWRRAAVPWGSPCLPAPVTLPARMGRASQFWCP
mmetsp:Transcript_114299/g.369563  ORF Transcript_114299/g.369563 Transcript_114299/m.369563 type:complete len:213 (+) Transcript_114299:1138-1776(+)